MYPACTAKTFAEWIANSDEDDLCSDRVHRVVFVSYARNCATLAGHGVGQRYLRMAARPAHPCEIFLRISSRKCRALRFFNVTLR